MVRSSTENGKITPHYTETVERIRAHIREADTNAFSKPVQLQEIVDEIRRLSNLVGYETGLAYAQFYSGRVLHKQMDFERALLEYRAALEFFEQRSDSHGMVICLHQIGLVHQLQSRYAEALEHFQSELEVAQQPQSGEEARIAMIWASIANIYVLTGQYDVALQQFMHALAVLNEHGDNEVRAGTLNNIAAIYTLLGNSEQGMEYLQKALQIWKEQGNKMYETNTLLNIGWNLLRLGRYEQALENSFTVLQLCDELNDKKRKGVVLLHIGQAYCNLQQFEQALSCLQQGYAIACEIGDRRNSADILRALGDMFVVQNDKQRAKEQYQVALSIVQEIGARQDEYEIYERLARIEKESGNAEHALAYYEEYMRVKEEVLDKNRQSVICEMQARFDVEQAQTEKEVYRLKNVELAAALQEVQILNNHLSEANNEKSELLSIVAHDLKNPLSGLSMTLSLLDGYAGKLSSQDVEKYVALMAVTVRRMNHIVTRLLEMSELEAGKLPFRMAPYDFCGIVQGVVEEYQRRGEQKDIVVKYVPEVSFLRIVVDKEAVVEIVDNLISNAVKYSPHHSVITVRLAVLNAMAVCEVEDRGMGINSEDMAKLFKKFSRVGSRPTGGESSTGLGLWIVKKLVEGMGGRVECESSVGKGSTFRVLFPALPLQEEGVQ